jgi:hypothetical protein
LCPKIKEEEEEKYDVGRFRDGLSVGHGTFFWVGAGRERSCALKNLAEAQMDERD